MEREKGIAYCGLACCVCSENVLCPGCRSGGCPGRETCKPFNCCIKKQMGRMLGMSSVPLQCCHLAKNQDSGICRFC